MMGQLFITKLDGIFVTPIAAFTLGAFVLIVVLCTLPFHIFYMTARWEMFKVLLEVFVSPFTDVTFKHFIVADILTSFVNPLKDLGATGCFFINGLWFNSSLPDSQNKESCPNLFIYDYIIMFLPFWFRFAQSMRRLIVNKL
jgi:EXS family